VAVTTLNGLPAFTGEAFPSPAQPNRFPGISAIPAQVSLDVDRSSGPFRGRLYMAYIDRTDPDARPFDEDVYLQFSDDQGATWSPRQRVNDDGIGNSQFFPNLSVDPTSGKVLISWYDTSRDPVNHQLTDVFLAVGNPSRHGVHFRKNLQVTDQQSDESVNNPQALGFYGDYEGLVAYGGVTHPVWCDARPDNFAAGLREEVFTAAVRYVDDDDTGEDAGSPTEPDFGGAVRGSRLAPAGTETGSASVPAGSQSTVDHFFASAPGEGRTPIWSGLGLHAPHRHAPFERTERGRSIC
jgi:hypothetical protein